MKVFVLRWEGNTDYTSGVSGVFRTHEAAARVRRDLENGEIEQGNRPYGREDDWHGKYTDAEWTVDYTIEELELED
jgi:hypothetical protein